ncbi:hypothetical protein [Anaeromicropila populeti]|nr:hypothetical protein [Anaeromicropila populeti]
MLLQVEVDLEEARYCMTIEKVDDVVTEVTVAFAGGEIEHVMEQEQLILESKASWKRVW